MYISAKQEFDTIYYWYRDEDGKLYFSSKDTNDYISAFYKHPEGEYKTIFGDRVRESYFDNMKELKNFKERKETLYESDIKPVHKFLSKNFYGMSNPKEYPVNVLLFDIEVDFDLDEGLGYPTADNPFGEINAVSAYDCTNKEYIMLMVADENKVHLEDPYDNLPVHCLFYDTESQLLRAFEELLEDFDVISAWNGNGFDIPYIIQRVKHNLGKNHALNFFCREDFQANERQYIDDYGNDAVDYTFYGRTHLDMMQLFKNFTFHEYPSYSLDNICLEELEEQKIAYDGDLGKLYREDPQKFFEYSLHDVYLMKRLHDKFAHIEIAITMARESTINFHEIFGSIKPIEMKIYNYCKFERNETVILPDIKDNEKEGFPGAFVYHTITGIHHAIATIDLGSLYPSTIRSLNISPETFIMQCKDKFDDFVEIIHRSNKMVSIEYLQDNSIFYLRAYEVKDLIEENGFTISANGSIFTNDFYGIIPEVLTVWAEKRNEYKALLKQETDEDVKSHYDLMQQLQKLYSNSTYGITSNKYSRFYDINIASSVTLSGMMVGKWQGYYSDKLLEELKEAV